MIRVVNKKSYTGDGYYIGRPSLLGNPFMLGKDGGRGEVVRKYGVWLRKEIGKRGEVYNELCRLRKIEDLVLICWCKPLACHGDIIRRAMERMREEKETTEPFEDPKLGLVR